MMAGITNAPLGLLRQTLGGLGARDGRTARHSAQRRLVDRQPHAAVGDRGADRISGRARLARRERERPERLSGPAARNGFLQYLRRRQLHRGRPPGRAIRSAAAACAREGDIRRGDAALRLALSAVLPLHRGAAGEHAVPRRAVRVAGGDARVLSAVDPRDRLSLHPSPAGGWSAKPTGWRRDNAPPRARLPGGVRQSRPRP